MENVVRTHLTFFLFSLVYLYSNSVFAKESSKSSLLLGVWSGHIGKQEITACFHENTNYTVTRGSYYYHRYRIPINLDNNQDASARNDQIWNEPDGVWRITSVSRKRISGSWSSHKGPKTLLIRLKKVALSAEDRAMRRSPCGSKTYNVPIEQSIKSIVGPTLSAGQIKYRTVATAFPSGYGDDYKARKHYRESVELIDDSTAIASFFNPIQIQHAFSITDLMECRLRAMNLYGREGSYFQDMRVSVRGRWLIANSRTSRNCGDRDLPVLESQYLWNITTGKRSSLDSWFMVDVDERHHNDRTDVSLPYGLDKRIASLFGQNGHSSLDDVEKCYGKYRPGAYSYKLSITDNGIVFKLPTTDTGRCGDSFEFTFAQLWNAFSSTGRKYALEVQPTLKDKR